MRGPGWDAEFRILGPLEVTLDGGGPARLRGRERELLSVLLLFGGRPCGLDQLARALWPVNLPQHPAKALRVLVSRVRSALREPEDAGVITTLPGAYRADPPRRALDLDRYLDLEAAARRSAAAGDLRQAASLFRQALACWREPPLADLPDDPGIAAEAGRLLERRRRATLDLADVHLALGMHEALLPELHARVVADPASDRAWEQLVTALSQAGRAGEALAACARARDALGAAGDRGAVRRLQQILDALLAGRQPALPVRAGRHAPAGRAAGRAAASGLVPLPHATRTLLTAAPHGRPGKRRAPEILA